MVETRRPHKHVTPARGGAHQPYAWWPADQAARLALALTVDDVRRQALQLDTGAVWEVVSVAPNVWRRMDAARAAIDALEATAPGTPIHVYVASTGVDTAAGTIAAPKRTIAGAWALLPPVMTACFVVHLGSGVHVYTTPPACAQRFGASIVVIGDGAGQAGDDGCAVQYTGTAGAGSTTSGIAAALADELYTGCTLEITSGPAAGNRRGIMHTRGGLIVPCNVLSAAPATGDSYRITRPSASLTVAATATITSGQRVSLVNLTLPTCSVPAAEDGGCWWFGVEQAGRLDFLGEVRCGIGSEKTPILDRLGEALGGALTTRWQGWGLLSVILTGLAAFTTRDAAEDFDGYVCFLSTWVRANSNLRGGRVASIAPLAGVLIRIQLNAVAPFMIRALRGTESRPFAMGADTRINCSGALEVYDDRLTSISNTAIEMSGSAALNVTAGLTVTTVMTRDGVRMFNMNGGARVDAATITIVSTPEVYAAIFLTNDAVINTGSLTCGSLIEIAGASLLETGTLQQSAQVTLRDAARMIVNGDTSSIVASIPGAAALTLADTAEALFHAPWITSTTTITNTSAAPNSDGVRLAGASRMCVSVDPAITTAGSSGFGVNVRGGGTFACAVAPTKVVGPTADFTIGTAAGEDFADTELAASFSARTRGGSTVLRSA